MLYDVKSIGSRRSTPISPYLYPPEEHDNPKSELVQFELWDFPKMRRPGAALFARRARNPRGALHKKRFLPRIFLAQRRKDAKRCRVFGGLLCVFAPLREK